MGIEADIHNLEQAVEILEHRLVDLENREAVDDGARIEIDYAVDRIFKLERQLERAMNILEDAGLYDPFESVG